MIFKELVQTCRAAIGDLAPETPVLVQVPGRRSYFSVSKVTGLPDEPALIFECDPPPPKPKRAKRVNPAQVTMFDIWGDGFTDAAPVQAAQIPCEAV